MWEVIKTTRCVDQEFSTFFLIWVTRKVEGGYLLTYFSSWELPGKPNSKALYRKRYGITKGVRTDKFIEMLARRTRLISKYKLLKFMTSRSDSYEGVYGEGRLKPNKDFISADTEIKGLNEVSSRKYMRYYREN